MALRYAVRRGGSSNQTTPQIGTAARFSVGPTGERHSLSGRFLSDANDLQ